MSQRSRCVDGFGIISRTCQARPDLGVEASSGGNLLCRLRNRITIRRRIYHRSSLAHKTRSNGPPADRPKVFVPLPASSPGSSVLCRPAGTPPPPPHRPQCSPTHDTTHHDRPIERSIEAAATNSSKRRGRSLPSSPTLHVKQTPSQAKPKPWRSRRRRAARCPLPLTWATSRHASGAFLGFGVVHPSHHFYQAAMSPHPSPT